MIQLRSDAFSNFTAASKSQDMRAMESIFIDMVSDVIAYKRTDLEKLLSQSDIKVPAGAKNDVLVKSILDNLNDNKKLSMGISYLIIQNQELLNELEKNEVRSDQQAGANPVNKTVDTDIIVLLNNKMKPVIESLKNKDSYSRIYQTIMQHIPLKMEAEQGSAAASDAATQSKKRKVWPWVLGAAILTGIIVAVIVRSNSRSQVIAPAVPAAA